MERSDLQPQDSGVSVAVSLGRVSANPKAAQAQPLDAWIASHGLRQAYEPEQRPRDQKAPPPPEPPPPPAPPSPRLHSNKLWRWAAAALVASAIAAAITCIILKTRGVIGSGGSSDDWQPLPFYQRRVNASAVPAFRAELHSWLLPIEQAALGLPALDADVIIVGAGMAGLAAANLLRANFSVLVLEARDRVGGRIHSVPFGSGGPSLQAELGAQYVLGVGFSTDNSSSVGPNPLTTAANLLGVQRVMVGPPDGSGPGRRRFRGDGASLTSPQLSRLLRWQSDAAALASNATEEESVGDVVNGTAMAARLTSGGGSLAANAPLLAGGLAAQYGTQYGSTLGDLSAMYFDNATTFGGLDNVVLGGFDRLPADLAAPLLTANRLLLSTPVASIQHGDSSAVVVTADGRQLSAQYVICTAPLGVLKAGSIDLEPALPDETQASLAGLGVGRLEKLWLEFDEAFWDDADCGTGLGRGPCELLERLVPPPGSWGGSIGTSGTGAVAWRQFVSMAAYTRQPVLVALAAAEAAEQLDGLSDETVVASAMSALQGMFPSAPAGPRSYLLSRWGQDPWAAGSLSYYAVGGSPSDRATLAEPQSGSLILAGEASSVSYPGTAHGALLSGIEAAYRVLDAAAELPQCGSGAGGSSMVSGGTCVAAAATAVEQAEAAASAKCQCDDLPPLPLWLD